MTKEEILSKLCYHDKRNPNCVDEDEDYVKEDPCYCDNCFKGKTPMAEYILELLNTDKK